MKKLIACAVASLLLGSSLAYATEWQPGKEQLSELYSGKAYSPYAGRTFPERPLWGDTHLHTSLFMDAGGFGNRLDPRAAYRFARGGAVIVSSGQPARRALSVTGDVPTEVYLDHRKVLAMKERGGARARVEAVEVLGVDSVEPGDNGGFSADAVWTVGGTVTHFGHRHFRQNRYEARVALVPMKTSGRSGASRLSTRNGCADSLSP